LSEEECRRIEAWIAQGAAYEPHWSFLPPRRSTITNSAGGDSTDPIDAFIAKGQQAVGVTFRGPADARTLARRLSFDVTGLPPSPDEVDAIDKETRPDRWDRWVDRLLASPAYGERMASYWFDLVRFADTVGYHGDQEHAIWPYRDYVVDAFNANLPFDQFTREQIAGDLLPERSVDQQIASAYNRVLQTSHEGGVQPKEYLLKYAADRVRNVSAVWLGLTMGCAECHDHKFDDLTQRDFYQLSAFFSDIEEKGDFKGAGDITPTRRDPEIEVLSRVDRERLADLQSRQKVIDAQLARLAMDFATSDWSDLPGQHPEWLRYGREREQLERERQTLSKRKARVMVTKSTRPRPVRVLARGDWMDETGPVVGPAVPTAFRDEQQPVGTSRRDLADWLTSRSNPLTARVLVNRLWYLFHGRGLAKNLEDVGSQGDWPTHPELLDTLALDLMESSWDVKGMVRRMVSTATYRQSSRIDEATERLDPNNDHWSRQLRLRWPAEMIRDAALVHSGLLVRTVGGRSVRPYQPAGYYSHLNFPPREYVEDKGSHLFRRSLYTHWQRQYLHPMLKAFDAPSREECTAQRQSSNTPAAALVLLNDPEFVEAARLFALRALQESAGDDQDRLDWMTREVFGRSFDEQERAPLMNLLQGQRKAFAQDPKSARALVSIGQAPSAVGGVSDVEWAAWTSVARVLFNLDEMVTRY
jgi:hypothetical protein